MSILYFGFIFLALISNGHCYAADTWGNLNQTETIGVQAGIGAAGLLAVTGGAVVAGKAIKKAIDTPAWIKSVQKDIKSYEKIENNSAAYDKLIQQIQTLQASQPSKASKLKSAQKKLAKFQNQVSAFVAKVKTIPVAWYIIFQEFSKLNVYPTSIDNLTNLDNGLPDDDEIAIYNDANIIDSSTRKALTYADAYEQYFNSEYKINIKLKNNVKKSTGTTTPVAITPTATTTPVAATTAVATQNQYVAPQTNAIPAEWSEQQYQPQSQRGAEARRRAISNDRS